MFEFRRAAGDSYYFDAPAKIGLVKLDERTVCLIDSGGDKDAGRRVRKALDANNWSLRAIYNTHSNADHIGGNQYLQAQTGCEIYAPGLECAFVNAPALEPAFLYGGFAPKDLRHKFLLAQPSNARPLVPGALPDGWETIALPGHFFDMVGFRTADDVVYLADCLSSEQTLEKYRISFVYDVAAYLQTLQKVKQMRAAMFVPSHAQATADIAPLAQKNIDQVQEIAQRILEICKTPVCFEQVLQALMLQYGLQMSFEQYALAGSTVRSYLAWLRDGGQLAVEVDGGRLLWKA